MKLGPLSFGYVYGGDETNPYMFRVILGHARLHIFFRGDEDEDPHCHPWDFWTLPLTPYLELVSTPYYFRELTDPVHWQEHANVVPAFRISYRPRTYTHRVLGRFGGWVEEPMLDTVPPLKFYPSLVNGWVVTLVWTGRGKRHAWGFLKHRDDKWCWEDWRSYQGGGKDAPCADDN